MHGRAHGEVAVNQEGFLLVLLVGDRRGAVEILSFALLLARGVLADQVDQGIVGDVLLDETGQLLDEGIDVRCLGRRWLLIELQEERDGRVKDVRRRLVDVDMGKENDLSEVEIDIVQFTFGVQIEIEAHEEVVLHDQQRPMENELKEVRGLLHEHERLLCVGGR